MFYHFLHKKSSIGIVVPMEDFRFSEPLRSPFGFDYRIIRRSIHPFSFVAIAFTEPRGKGNRLSLRIQMGCVAKL